MVCLLKNIVLRYLATKDLIATTVYLNDTGWVSAPNSQEWPFLAKSCVW